MNDFEAYWSNKLINSDGTLYSKKTIKIALRYLLDNCPFNISNYVFRHIIEILMGSDTAPFFANLLNLLI